MNEGLFENMAGALRNSVAKEIAYIYSVFIANNTDNIHSKMKSNILLPDRKFLDSSLQDKIGNKLIFPYEVLKESIEKQINEFYSEFNLSNKTLKELSRYGDRADAFKRRFRENLEKSKVTTLDVVLQELNLKVMQGEDAKSVITHMQNVLSKRLTSLKQLLKESAGQMQQYMLLWDYQDKGYTRYRLRTNGDNCEDCTNLDGKIFAIHREESGKNFMHLHPNCDCSVEVLDDDGNAVFVIEKISEDEESTDTLDYLETSLKQIVLGNYTEDTNMLGTLGQVALGLIGLDLPSDIRDLLYDITHFKLSPEHSFQTIIDILALLPVVGGVKYIDDAGDALRVAAKYGEEATAAVKAVKKATDFSSFSKEIHVGKQGKPILGHNNYIKGKSILNISIQDAQGLVNKYSGSGQKIGANKERVNFKIIIGQYIEPKTGKAYDTTIGTIHYSNSGTHIVPEKPRNWRK